ncbi:MAG: hypothetical protein LBH10_03985 [Burkholderiaceae bacterium]|nr:hypothetical protein [Burkholderiaceae bacterium]
MFGYKLRYTCSAFRVFAGVTHKPAHSALSTLEKETLAGNLWLLAGQGTLKRAAHP